MVVEKPVEVDERTKFEMGITQEQIEERAQELEEQEAWRHVVANLPGTLQESHEQLGEQAKLITALQEQVNKLDRNLAEARQVINVSASLEWAQKQFHEVENRIGDQGKKIDALQSTKIGLENISDLSKSWAQAVREAIEAHPNKKMAEKLAEIWEDVTTWLNEKPNKEAQ